MLRIFVVDDSPFIRKALERVIGRSGDMKLVGSASSGQEAITAIPLARPDLVTLDLEMPGMGGIQVLKRLLEQNPALPIVILSAHAQEGAATTLDALALGAVDFIDKTRINLMDLRTLETEVVDRFRDIHAMLTAPSRASRGRLRPQVYPTLPPRSLQVPGMPTASLPPRPPDAPPPSLTRVDWLDYDLCVIGASTGGPPAVQAIVDALPDEFPIPIVVVQHMPVGFTGPFAERLDQRSQVRVVDSVEGERLLPGKVLIARAGTPLRINADMLLGRDSLELHVKHVPSVNRMMQSAAEAFPGRVLGVLLTGMGDDGAEGMRTIHAQGTLTIGESEATCVVYGMPRAAHNRGGVSHMLPLYDIVRLFARL